MSKYSDDELIEKIKSDYQLADDLTGPWREEAISLYDMIAGHQWPELDKMKMEEELRPAVTFNLAAKYLDAICGLQVANRQEVRYTPRHVREPGIPEMAEIMTGAAKWARGECDAETEESEAFTDCVLTGLGVVEQSLSFDDHPDGMIVVERRDPIEMYWDTMSRKRNLVDAKWVIRVKFMEEDEIDYRWPGATDRMTDATMGLKITQDHGAYGIHVATEAWKYEHDAFRTEGRALIPVFEYQWWEPKNWVQVKVQSANGPQERRISRRNWKMFKQLLDNQNVAYQTKFYKEKVFYRAFVAGGVVLKRGESPYQAGFTYQFITGKRDRNQNTWHGLGRSIRDPQTWVNKFFSDILYIIQSNAKGGILAEEDAFSDPQKAEATWARPDSITWVEQGALRDGKITGKPQADYPTGLDRLMMFAMNAMPETTGMNLEIMGMANRTQPGIVEQQRKQAAMTVIQWAFDSLRRYYKLHGRQLAAYIRDYIADGRLVRIGKQDQEQYIPLVRDRLNHDFEIIVDEAPQSTNQKEKVFAYLMELLPYMAKAGVGFPPEFFEYSPLPTEMVKKLLQRMQGMEEQQAQAAQQAQALESQERQADIEETRAAAAQKVSTAQLNQAKARETAAKTGVHLGGGI